MFPATLRFRLALGCLLLTCLAAAAFAAEKKPAATLSTEIGRILDQPDISRGFWGVEVVSLANGNQLYSLNADKLFTPASNTKLFTTAATLAMIGPDYKFRTTVETLGTIDKHGRLNGDLLLVGRGDPNISGRTLPYNTRTERKQPPLQVLQELADDVVQKGVRFIDGDVIGDDSYYAFERYGEGWTQDDLVWEWGAPVSALTINDNVVFVSIQPGDHAGDKAFLSIAPYASYYQVDNRVITTPAGTGPRRLYITRQPGANQITFWGNIPLDDQGASEAVAIEDPASFAAQVFRQMLEQRGITVYGHTRTHHTELARLTTITVNATAPAGGGELTATPPTVPQPLVLGSYESQPLSQDIRVILKVSQNLHAELALRLLGREKGSAGTIEAGLEVLHGFLAQAGLQNDEYVFFDGSGLSRQNLVTPHAIVKLLSFAAQQPWYTTYRESLPVAGIDGSLADRLKNTPAQANVFAKTGSLGHVNTLSGYARTRKGDMVAFSIMGNNHNLSTPRALEAIDQIVEAIVDYAPAAQNKK
ncbi:MAG TPA: D-alanyl-D-alanine carboxypeptidase/D-alanyl-D-alanine-endopeptidase [Terriglobales bacterium]|nr:D-alanyl-D-alanine carboxypeptidase/D-alanyl-D-alanine-endopeptidase [Terriglobales bacterium]